MSNETVFVKILDKEYQVACPPEECSALLQSAHILDEKMRMIKNAGSVIGLERIAVMAALNLSHELLQSKSGTEASPSNTETLQRLQEKIEVQLDAFR